MLRNLRARVVMAKQEEYEMPINTNYPPLYTDEEMEKFKKQANVETKRIAQREPIKISNTKAKTPLARRPISSVKQEPKPSFNAMDTVPANLGTPERSPIFNRARQNLQKGQGFDKTVWGSPFVKDPTTGKMIEKAGYYTEGNAFVEGARVKPWEQGTLANYATSGIDDPKMREIITQGIANQAGVIPETEGMGAGLNRALDERLTRAKLASGEKIAALDARTRENVARIGGEYGLKEAETMSSGKTTEPLKMYGGTLTREDEMGVKREIPYSEYTGQTAPGYEAEMTELPADIKAHIDKIKNNSQFDEWFRSQDELTRVKIRKYLGK